MTRFVVSREENRIFHTPHYICSCKSTLAFIHPKLLLMFLLQLIPGINASYGVFFRTYPCTNPINHSAVLSSELINVAGFIYKSLRVAVSIHSLDLVQEVGIIPTASHCISAGIVSALCFHRI